MEIEFHKQFRKQYKKLPLKIQNQFNQRLELLIVEPRHPQLHLHTLTGADYPTESINITGDYRALFLRQSDLISFIKIGSHSNLY